MAANRERSAPPVAEPVGEDADQLRALVSAMLSGTYKEESYLWDVAWLCRTKPQFARQLLTLIDRYYRLGQMPAAQHRRIKEKIEQTVAPLTGESHLSPRPKSTPTDPPPESLAGTPMPAAAPAPSTKVPSSPEVPTDATVTAPLPVQTAAPVRSAAPRARQADIAVSAVKPSAAPMRSDAPASAAVVTPAVPPPAVAAAVQAAAAASMAAPAAATPAPAPAAFTATQVAALMAAESASAIEAETAHTVTIGPGTVLRKRYELQALLGSGGMGSVYKALDRYRASLGLPDCCVALKIASVQSSGSGNVMALGREFHNAQQLSHPNVINVYEIDHEGEASFYTMELLEGERLSQLLERIGGPLPTRYALTIIRDIGAALAHAHSRTVIHADVKPHNIFVTYGGQVRVLDFGGLSFTPLEPYIEEPSFGAVRQNGVGASYRTATPAFASCEQLEGQRADLRDDIYALGVIAYELLSGEHPFNGKTSLDARALHLRPKRPPGLRAESWRALRRALALSRAQRPSQIEPWLAQLGVAAAAERLPPSYQLFAIKRSRPWIHRGALAATLLLGVAGAAFGIAQQNGLGWQRTLAATQATAQSAWAQLMSAVGTRAAQQPTPPPNVLQATPSSGDVASPNARISGAASGTVGSAASAGLPAPLDRASGSTVDSDSSTRATHRAAAGTPASSPDDSVAPIGVKFASLNYDVADTAPAARLVIRRTGGSRNDVRFVWWTEQASAKADVDYAPLGRRTEHIPSGADNIIIYVPIISNPLRHQSTKFYVALGVPEPDSDASPDSARAAVSSERATVTIERGG